MNQTISVIRKLNKTIILIVSCIMMIDIVIYQNFENYLLQCSPSFNELLGFIGIKLK